MSKKSKNRQNALIADGKNILLQPAGRVLAGIIQQKEAAFHAAWAHFQTAENDSEALHNMRVELRRLRVWLKLARRDVKTNQPACKRLQALAKASNPLRDHEVLLSWLARAQLQLTDAPTLGNLIDYGKQSTQQSTKLRFSEKQRLKPQAKHKNGIHLGIWLNNTVEQRVELIAHLLHAGKMKIHRARIEIKYLRYLLEPFTYPFKNAKKLVEWCKHVQEILGDVHDVQVFRSHLPEFACWVIDCELAKITLLAGKQTKAITKVFANAREPVIALAGWQNQELQRQWGHWLTVRDNYLSILQNLQKTPSQATR